MARVGLSGESAESTKVPEVPKPEEITIVRSITFEDADWGLGMFGDKYLRTVVQGDLIYLVEGSQIVEIGPNVGLGVEEARSVALILMRAADELERIQASKPDTSKINKPERF